MVNKPLIRPYFLGGGVALGGVARIPLIIVHVVSFHIELDTFCSKERG